MDLLVKILSRIDPVIALIVFISPTRGHDEIAVFIVVSVNEVRIVPIDAPEACWRFCLLVYRLAGRV